MREKRAPVARAVISGGYEWGTLREKVKGLGNGFAKLGLKIYRRKSYVRIKTIMLN